MNKRPDSFLRFLGSTFISTQGIIIDTFGLFFGFILWAYSSGDTILLRTALFIVVPCVILIFTLLTASYNLFITCKQSLPKVVKVRPYLAETDDSSILLLLEPSELFPPGIQASIFYYDDKIEQIIGLGTVVNVQEDGYVQVAATRFFDGYEEVLNDLRKKTTFDLDRIKVKPVVPQLAPAPIQNVIEIETKPYSKGQEFITDGMAVSEGAASKLAPSPDDNEKPQPFEAQSNLDWQDELIVASLSKDDAKFEETFQRILSAEADPIEKAVKETFYLWLRYCNGDTSSLFKLQEFTKQPEVAAHAYSFIGYCYNAVEQYDKAQEAFEQAARNAKDEGQKISALLNVANCLVKLSKPEQAFEMVIHYLGRITDKDRVIQLYEGLASLYEEAEDLEMRALALEKVLEIKPNDINHHFNAGYSYSQKPLHSLAFLHYKTLLHFDGEHSTALNNIAVVYEKLAMPIQSVRYYKKAVEHNETLASANLAKLLLYTGFSDEALEILNRAKEKDGPHEDIAKVIASVPKNQERESKIEKQVLQDARRQHSFLITFANAYFVGYGNRPKLDGVWVSSGDPDTIAAIYEGTEVTIKESDSKIEGSWEGGASKMKFNGVLSNWAARIKTFEMKVYEKEFKEDDFGYIYLSPDGKQILLMRVFSERITLFTVLSRIEEKQASEKE